MPEASVRPVGQRRERGDDPGSDEYAEREQDNADGHTEWGEARIALLRVLVGLRDAVNRFSVRVDVRAVSDGE